MNSPLTPSGLRETLLRRVGVPGKDVLQFARVPIAIWLALVLVWALIRWLPELGGATTWNGQARWAQWEFAIISSLATATAYLLGLMVIGEEEEAGTQAILDRLPAHPAGVAVKKILAGYALCIPWSLAACILVHVTSPHPADVVERLLLAPWSGMSPISMLAALLTGAAAATWIRRNLVLAALVGALLLLPTWILPIGTDNRHIDTAVLPSWYTLPWSAVMLLAILWKTWRRREFESPRYHVNVEIEEIGGAEATPVGGVTGRLLRNKAPVVVLLGLLGGALLGKLEFGIRNDEVSLPWALLPPALLGVVMGAWTLESGERDGARFFAWALPIDPARHLLRRQVGLVIFGGLAGLLADFGWDAASAPGFRTRTEEWTFFCLWPILGASAALLTHFIHLFHRSRLVTGALALVVASCWACAIGIQFGVLGTGQTLWLALVATVLPAFATLVAVCGSPLLEANEGRRSWMSIIILGVLTAWGMVLLTASPTELRVLLDGVRGTF